MREGTDKYDDTEKGGYSYSEKLKLVAAGQMDPQEIGLPPENLGQKQAIDELDGKKPPVEKLGDFVTFEASVVPPQLRAHWEWQDLKIKPDNEKAWVADWVEKHKDEYAIQGKLHSGMLLANVGQLFKDPILGFVSLLRISASLLEQKYEELKKTDPNPIITREEVEKNQDKLVQ